MALLFLDVCTHELARDYHLKLVEFGGPIPTYWIFAGLRSFEEMRIRAKEGIYYQTAKRCAELKQSFGEGKENLA